MESVDVAIIGGGPAGSAAAICLARSGYRVTLVDKEEFPREKLCGDFINPIDRPVFRRLGVEEQLLASEHETVSTFRLTSFSGEEAEVPLPFAKDKTTFGLGVKRSALDHVLLKAAAQSAEVFQGCRIRDMIRTEQGWRLTLDNAAGAEEISARMLIGADGRNSWVARRLGVARAGARHGGAIGFQERLNVSRSPAGIVEIHLFPGGYAGLVGVGGGVFNLCLAVDRRRFQHQRSVEQLLESCLALNPHLKQILRRSERLGELRSTYPVYFPPRRAYGDGWVLVGDAACVSEPVTGEGIYFALRSGEIAARTIDAAFRQKDFSAERLRLYERDCRSLFQTRRRVNALIRWLIYHPALISPFLRFAAGRSRLLDSLVQTVCRPEAASESEFR